MGHNIHRSTQACVIYYYTSILDKQEAHGPHRSSERQFESINISVQSYDYTITLIKRKKPNLLFEN